MVTRGTGALGAATAGPIAWVMPPHEYAVRLRANRGIVDAHVLFTPLSPRLWSFTMVLPPDIRLP